MMEWIMNDWYILISLAAMLLLVFVAVVDFTRQPREEQIEKVREWLLYAVIEAERLLGASTGQLKLAMVFDMFAERFPWMTKVISFERFSKLVDEALVEMRELLAKNKAIKAVVDGELP